MGKYPCPCLVAISGFEPDLILVYLAYPLSHSNILENVRMTTYQRNLPASSSHLPQPRRKRYRLLDVPFFSEKIRCTQIVNKNRYLSVCDMVMKA